MLGLDVLQPLTLHLDYRDGLVKFEPLDAGVPPGPGKAATIASTPSAPANNADEPVCPPMSTADRPVDSTIEARVPGGLDSAHLKPGKDIWVKVVYGQVYPGCTLDAESILYGRVMSTTSTKNPDASELSIQFDRGDCAGHSKKELSLRLIGLVGPPEESKMLHDALPTEVAGAGRQMNDAVAGTGKLDENLNPGGPPHTIHAGIVVRLPEAKLDPQGGPGCSAKITSTKRSVQLGPGSELILTMVGPG
jgi:hypothetical protein